MDSRLESTHLNTQKNPPPLDATSLELDPEAMRNATDACARFVIEHIGSLSNQPIVDLEGARELAETFMEPVPRSPTAIEDLLPRIDQAVRKTFNTASPGYLAFIPGGGIYPSTLAEFISMSVNRYTGMWNAAPVLVQMELAAIDWIRELVRVPKEFGGLLTSGGSISSLIAIITARRTRLPENFLRGTIYASRETHHCVAKSALLAGFPESNLRWVDTDDRLRMKTDSLMELIKADREKSMTPLMVVTNAGTTNTGAIDPTPEIANICRRENLWLHVDAAYGGFFRMVDGGEELIPGLELADSIVLDPHKGLFVPYGTGCLLMRDPELLRQAHQLSADYMQDLHSPEGSVNFADMSPELSRDYRGLRIWLPFKMFGVDAFRDNLREKLELASWAHQELLDTPGFECFDEPQLSIVAFRYVPKSGDIDAFNERLCRHVIAKGRVFLTSTMVHGKFMLRIAVLSFRSHSQHLMQAIEDIRESAIELESEQDN